MHRPGCEHTGQASEKTKQPPIRVIHFKYIKAADALKLFKQLNGVSDEEIENAAGLALDERTNSIILMMPDPDDQQDAEELEAIFKALDIDVPAPQSTLHLLCQLVTLRRTLPDFRSQLGSIQQLH